MGLGYACSIELRGNMELSGRVLAVGQVSALSYFDNVTIRVANVAARLAVLWDRLGDELGSPAFPRFVARLNIRDPDVHEAVDMARVRHTKSHGRLVRR